MMPSFLRSSSNPILTPDVRSEWQSYAVFNPTICRIKDTQIMFYRALSSERSFENHQVRMSSIGVCQATGNGPYGPGKMAFEPSEPWERFGCEDPRATVVGDKIYLFYTAVGIYPHVPHGIRVACAVFDLNLNLLEKRLVTPFNAKAMALFPEKIGGKHTVVLTVDSDLPPAKLAVAQVDSFETLWSHDFWKEWRNDLDTHVINAQRLNTDHLEVGANPVRCSLGWLQIYAHIQHYNSEQTLFGVEALVLDADDPRKILRRSRSPLLVPEKSYELDGTVPNVIFPTCIERDAANDLVLYYGAADTVIAKASISEEELIEATYPVGIPRFKLTKPEVNPIIAPIWDHEWERSFTLNPGALYMDDLVHIFYRAQGVDGVSVLGYAASKDGVHIGYRSPRPVYQPRIEEEKPKSKGFSGCEDARLVHMGDEIVMTYTAYDGVNAPRIAMTRIGEDDFLRRKWNMWSHPVVISEPDPSNKNCCIFPEKINGKYVFLHRIEPNITFDFRDSLDFKPGEYLQNQGEIHPRDDCWDAIKIGISGPPIKTQHGWLLMYHGISHVGRQYRVGAMLLDLKDPRKVLSRSPDPILEPEFGWETQGLVNNVVFPCSLIEIEDQLFVYYGGADSSIGVAHCSRQGLIDYLLSCASS